MSKKYKIEIVLVLFVLLITQSFFVKADSKTIFKAMEDEMTRNMNELKYEDYNVPFFMEYRIHGTHSIQVQAKMGALLKSDEKEYSNISMSLKVGDYMLNDENWDDKTTKINHNDGYSPYPKYDDYWAIRRSFWIMSNNLYKSAAEKFRNKKMAIEEKGLTVTDLVAPDFSKAEVTERMIDPIPDDITKIEIENRSKSISGFFTKFPDVIDSEVEFNYLNLNRYYVNSEGTKTLIPYRIYKLEIKASVFSKEYFKINESLIYLSESIGELPSENQMIEDAKLLVQNLQEKAIADQFDETYLGPVIFKGNTVNEKLLINLFKKGEGLLAKRQNLIKSNEGVTVANIKTWDEKKDKKVVDSKLTIYSTPFLKTFMGKKLIGSFEIDHEGVVPVDTLMLIEKGKLKNQFNNRIPTPSQLTSNGHIRYYIRDNGASGALGPDVVFVNSDETQSVDELEKRLNEIADDEGLDYVFEISSLATHANSSPVNYYKIDLASGKRTLLRSVKLETSGRELLKIEGVSAQQQVVNTLVPDIVAAEERLKQYAKYPPEILAQYGISLEFPFEGTPTSIICPEALLFEQIELSGVSKVVDAEKPVVPYHMAVQ